MKTAVKDFLLILLFAVTVSPVFAGLIKFSDKGLISDGKFAPVQVGVGLFEPKHLFYTNQPALFSLGFFGVKHPNVEFDENHLFGRSIFSKPGSLTNNVRINIGVEPGQAQPEDFMNNKTFYPK